MDLIYLNCDGYKNKIDQFYADITKENILLPTRMTILLQYTNIKSDITKMISEAGSSGPFQHLLLGPDSRTGVRPMSPLGEEPEHLGGH